MGSAGTTLARQSAVFVWPDRALFIGDRSETSLHSHHAIELSVALDDLGIDLSAPGGPSLAGVGGAVVRAGAEHRLAIPGPKVAVLYVDPQSDMATSLHEWLGAEDLRALPRDVVGEHRTRLRSLLETTDLGLQEAKAGCSALLACFAQESPRPAVDYRVRRAIVRIDEALDEPPTLEELASELKVSSSHLRHMFREQVGLPLSRYVLWMRLRAGLLQALQGKGMAESAQAAGFSDAAHFTRTCRQMFGLPPTAFAPVDRVFVE
jgi:AraC-like DNA-binding protein